jgi:hypothetical protein
MSEVSRTLEILSRSRYITVGRPLLQGVLELGDL